MTTTSERNAAWRSYQNRLPGTRTGKEEAQIERAFFAGWAARHAADDSNLAKMGRGRKAARIRGDDDD